MGQSASADCQLGAGCPAHGHLVGADGLKGRSELEALNRDRAVEGGRCGSQAERPLRADESAEQLERGVGEACFLSLHFGCGLQVFDLHRLLQCQRDW